MQETKKKRSFTELKKTMSSLELEKFCNKIATEYATSEGAFSRSYFVKEYEISASCFYKILSTAVVNSLVTLELVFKMEEKACKNQKAHAEEAGHSSRIHYAKLRQKRKEHTEKMIANYSDEEIKVIAKKFGSSPEISKQKLAKELKIPVAVFDRLLEKAIIQSIIDDNIFEKIKIRSMKNLDGEKKRKAQKYFCELEEKRKKTAKNCPN